MHVLHGGNEEQCCVVWVREDFVAYGNGGDGGGLDVWEDVGLDPCVGEGWVVRGGGEVVVGEGEDGGNGGAGEGFEDGGVGVEEFDVGDSCGV